MKRYPLILPWLVLAATTGWPEPAAQSGVVEPGIEVFYIPNEDMPRAPGYSDAGVFLPLSEILRLAREAQRPDDLEPRPGPVYCPFIDLKGTLGTALALDGRLSFRTPSETWSATLIDDGHVPWISQAATTGTLAFLARLNGRTYLFAKGPTSSTLRLRVLMPVEFQDSQATLSFGRLYAPCRMDVDLGEGVQLTSATVPVAGAAGRAASGALSLTALRDVAIWPAREGAAVIHLRRRASLDSPPSLRANLARTVEAVGGGLEVTDELTLEDRFSPGAPLRLPLPAGMSLLRVEARGPARLSVTSETLTLTPFEEAVRLTVRAVFAAKQGKDRATLGPWGIRAVAQSAALTLRASDPYAPILIARPSLLAATGGNKTERRYACWGPLPPLDVALVRQIPPQPPGVATSVTIARNAAIARCDVKMADQTQSEIGWIVPPGWILTDFEARQGRATLSCVLQQEASGRWRAQWDPATPPAEMRIALHHLGAWGAPGTTASMAMPLLRFDGPRPSFHDIVVSWPEELDTRATSLSGLVIIPVETAKAVGPASAPAKLAFRATGDDPRGALTVRGRNPDVQVSVVSALSIGEDKADVRTLLGYKVKLAPTTTFRFTLPAGTGRLVKIEGEGIRETTLRETAEGDEWTVVTQQGILGDYPLTLEWPLAVRPTAETVVAPQIQARGVTSQQGFLILEGSETLALTADTKNLTEADLMELPPLPWKRESRILAVYRYIQPPYLLQVTARKYQPESPLKALARECELTTTLSPEGDRLTQASYVVAPTNDNQFLEVRLPAGAQVWSVLVNGQGVKPARVLASADSLPVLVPLPAVSVLGADSFITLLYFERGNRLADSTHVRFAGPALSAPVNRTVWSLFLPADFEYLTFRDHTGRTVTVRESAARFFRTAYYPARIVFMESEIGAILWVTLAGVVVFLLIRNPRRLIRILSVPLGGRRSDSGIPEGQAPVVRVEAPKPAEPVPHARGCAGRVLFFIFVGFLVLVLCMISVPNFMEAQVRSKVSRVRTDLRSLATAIEAYYVDNNMYPPRMELLYQGPVKYMTSPPVDSFAASYLGASGQGYLRYAPQWEPPQYIGWHAWSIGPDQRDDGGQIVYDPTNGTVSVGDIVRAKDGGAVPFQPRYAQRREEEAKAIARGGMLALVDRTPRPAPGQARPTPKPIPPAPPSGTVAGLPVKAAVISGISDLAVGPQEEMQRFVPKDVSIVVRAEGLLSLQIEPLQSGTPRRFETLGGDPWLEIRLMEWKQYRRLSFIVWIAAFLLLAGLWMVGRRVYPLAFVIGIGITILLPVMIQTTWAPFFNAAFQGILFSLLAPLLSPAWKRLSRSLAGSTMLILLLATAVCSGGGARAESAAQDRPPASQPPVRILVPYDAGTTRGLAGPVPSAKENPLAFLSKTDFTRLWKAAQRETPPSTCPAPILGQVRLEGTLAPEKSTVAGELSVSAVNPTSAPAAVFLRLAGLMLEDWSAGARGASLEARRDGLWLHIAPNWIGTVTARFVLPCEVQGAAGQLGLQFPETAAGLWRITIPYAGVVSEGPGPHEWVIERLDGATALMGPIRPGPLRLSWGVTRAMAGATTATATAPAAWEAEIATHVEWADLSSARWSGAVQLRSTTPGRPLPSEIRLTLDPGLLIFAAQGDMLLSAVVTPRSDGAATSAPARPSETVLRLAESASARIALDGILPAPAAGASAGWAVPGIRAPQGLKSHTMLRLEIADAIEVKSVRAQGLERRSAADAPGGRSVHLYEATGGDWEMRMDLRAVREAFTANVTEVFAPGDGFLRQAAHIDFLPRNSALHEGVLDLPRGARVVTLEGAGIAGWVQSGQTLFVAFAPPVRSAARATLTAASDLPASFTALSLLPLAVRGALETRRSAVVVVSPDAELAELDLAGATPRPPTGEDQKLARLVAEDELGLGAGLRAYVLAADAALRFGLKPLEATSLETVFSRVTVAEGVESLDCVVRAEPRRGRLRRIEAMLLLAVPDLEAASRLEVGGAPLREVRIEPVSDRVLHVAAELNAPQTRPVDLRLHLDQPAVLEENKPIRAMAVVPVNKSGARAFLQLRRLFEGELTPADLVGARTVDPASVQWPDVSFRPLPADQGYELPPTLQAGPLFNIVRHARTEALRAVVELMRQRTILTADGFERHELEIVLQNQSEQFLKIALPYPKDRVTIYETQVASRGVKATFGEENGRGVILVPLIRTGLLDPELTVRVAYAVAGGVPLAGTGRREQRLPEILGGVPVAQSALVLLLPSNYKYSKFKGTLNQVELVDLEVDEALRSAKKVERLSEIALKGGGKFTETAGKTLYLQNQAVLSQMGAVKQRSEAQQRESSRQTLDRDEKGRQVQLMAKREADMKEAEAAFQKAQINVGQLTQIVGAPVRQPAVAEPAAPPPPSAPPISFPRVGDVFVFRQLQGTGHVAFHYASRESASRRYDLLFGLALVLVVAIAAFNSRRLFASTHRVVLAVLAVGLLAILFRVALDVVIPVVAIAMLYLLLKRKKMQPAAADPV